MSKTCVLTDEMAQFLDLSFSGQELVHLMPVQVIYDGPLPEGAGDLRVHHLPSAKSRAPLPDLKAPSVEQYVQAFANLSKTYNEIVAILPAAGLTKSFENAAQAVELTRGQSKVMLVDTQAVGVGQGVLAAAAAQRADTGGRAADIKRDLLGLSARVYAVFCIKNLAYLVRLKLASPAQALIGEMLEVQQLYYLNAGTLVPVQKIRNSRHMVESVLEFVAEFDEPLQVALQQSAIGYHQEARTIRERLNEEHPQLRISEMAPSLPMGALFGPQAFGLYLWEI